MRADIHIAKKFHFSRHRAQDLIRSGLVLLNGAPLKKT